ncbi:streptococcal hemagglutinin-like [Argiope bruennichi]|uniref:streptococcal hemagglutinin-like n=1 Tax=Argiope bruennichi TaxID=94029 RepID=UPI002493DD60|nr:streptococcal hemagglutinin-like [Argiope bruennichi]
MSQCREDRMPYSLAKLKKVAAKRLSTFTKASGSMAVNRKGKKKFIAYKGFDIVSQPLRKRIIHMLALKPSKKSEILDRLIKEGISEYEKTNVFTLLYQISSSNIKIFHLKAQLWQEVEDDWRFYSPEEAIIVRKKKQEACQTDVNIEPKNPSNVLPSKKHSLVDDTIASSMPIQKKQKESSVKEENPSLFSLLQYVRRNSTHKNCPSPNFESKESNNQVTSPPSSNKKYKKIGRIQRKKDENAPLSHSEEKSDMPSTVINMTHPVLLKDSCPVEKITSPSVVPSSTIGDTTLDPNKVSFNNSSSFLSFKDDSCLAQKAKVPFLKEAQSNNTSQIVGKPTISKAELQNLDSFNSKSEEINEKGILSTTVMELPELVSKQGEFVLTDCLKNSEPHASRIQELSSPSAFSSSHCTSLSLFNPKSEETHEKGILPTTIMELPELDSKQGEFVPTDCLKNSEPHASRIQELSSPSASASSSALSAALSSFFASASSSALSASLSSHSAFSSSLSAPASLSSLSASLSLNSASLSSHSASLSSLSASASLFSHSASLPSHTASLSSHSASLSSHSASASLSSYSVSASLPSLSASSSPSVLYSMYKILATQNAKSPDHNADTFKRKFPKITSFVQRDIYKEQFDYELPIYEALLKSVNKANKRMRRLEGDLKTFKEGTLEYEAALMELCKAYKMYIQDSMYKENCRVLCRMRDSLFYLRHLILEFDKEHDRDLSSNNSE